MFPFPQYIFVPLYARFCLLLMWLILTILAFFSVLGDFSFVFVGISFFYVGTYVDKKSSLQMMFFLGFSAFIFLPALFNWYYLNVGFEIFYVSSIASLVFLKLTDKTLVRPAEDYGSFVRVIFVLVCIFSLFLIIIGYGSLVKNLFVLLIFFLAMSFRQGRFVSNATYLSVFLIVFLAYVFIAWSGFGRTVVFSWLILAGLYFLYSINFYVNKYAFSLIPGVASVFLGSRDLLKLDFSGFESALYDSAFGPYRLASGFIDHFNERGHDFGGFLDQLVFSLFVFIPRDLWEDKPLGFGFEYTVRHLASHLIESGHSVASTLIGDHIYYLGYLGIFSGIIVLITLAFIANFLYRIKGLNGNGVIIFSASMMVLVWGGMTSFSARIALPSIIFLIFFVFLKNFIIRRTRLVWRR